MFQSVLLTLVRRHFRFNRKTRTSPFVDSINSNIKTPYAETFNLTVQHEFARGLTVTASYVGRLGRHVLSDLDVAQPSNVFDPMSGQTYFEAATNYAKMVDAGVSPGNVPNNGYFQNFFPNAKYKNSKQINYTGAQAYYAYLNDNDRGNETDPLFNFDTDPCISDESANLPLLLSAVLFNLRAVVSWDQQLQRASALCTARPAIWA